MMHLVHWRLIDREARESEDCKIVTISEDIPMLPCPPCLIDNTVSDFAAVQERRISICCDFDPG
jgi:hypothetical protein